MKTAIKRTRPNSPSSGNRSSAILRGEFHRVIHLFMKTSTSKSVRPSLQATNSIAPEVISAAIHDGVGLDAERIYEAISEGVYRAMWQVITNATSMPCHDFYYAIKEAAQTAFENAATPNEQ